MNLKQLLPHLLHQFKSEDDLVRAIHEISLKFTVERGKINDYLNDPRLVSAYTAFYLTTNIPKLAEVLRWLPAEWKNHLTRLPMVDVGAGPGTFSLAWKAWSRTQAPIVQIETSALMREQARKIWAGFHPEAELRQSSRPDRVDNSFLLFGHSANEMGPEAVMNYVETSGATELLFIEPGTKSFFPEMLKIRRALISDGFHVLFPCPKNLECPMKNSESDWCHQFVQVSQEQDVERLTQMARKDRKLLPLIVHAYSKTFKAENPKERIVRVLPETKFSYEWEVCQDNELKRYQAQKRNLQKSTLKNLAAVLAGDSVVTALEKSTDQYHRVKVTQINNKDQ